MVAISLISSFIIHNLFVKKVPGKDMHFHSGDTVIDDLIVKGDEIIVEFLYINIYKMNNSDKIAARFDIQGTITVKEPTEIRNVIEKNWAMHIGPPKDFFDNTIHMINQRCKPMAILISFALEIPVPLKPFTIKRMEVRPEANTPANPFSG